MDTPANPVLPAPAPLAGPGQPVDWMFAFKFNASSFPGCDDNGTVPVPGTNGIFGGTVRTYPEHSQQYVFATSLNPALVKGAGCLGATLTDPLGATFAQVYNTPGYYYVLWNDQFDKNPVDNMDGPWGHAKGMLAWNDDGEGFVLQVSTPSWPASGCSAFPRQNDGNTLSCILDDDIELSQHFFALKLNKDDVVNVLRALQNASVVTSKTCTNYQSIFQNGGPPDIQLLVNSLGTLSASVNCTLVTLSGGVQLISKPSSFAVPPWQLVSSKLSALPLRVANYWAKPYIYSTTAGTPLPCWAAGLAMPGPVAIATTGSWAGNTIGLEGGDGGNFNHAKIGISTDSTKPICIFGDMNQQGALGPDYAYTGQTCSSSQNGRGGTFYVLQNQQLFDSLTALLTGNTALASGPNGE